MVRHRSYNLVMIGNLHGAALLHDESVQAQSDALPPIEALALECIALPYSMQHACLKQPVVWCTSLCAAYTACFIKLSGSITHCTCLWEWADNALLDSGTIQHSAISAQLSHIGMP